MKPYYFALLGMLFIIGCSGNDSSTFPGVWQQMDDPSKTISITQTGENFFFETVNMDSPSEGVSGTYNKDKQALEFDNGNGTITTIVYDPATKHIRALGEEFEKTSDAVAENSIEEETSSEEVLLDAEETDETTGTASNTVGNDEEVSSSKCKKGKALVINGDNVRLRTEPDVTKQNILMQLNKGYEVVHLGDKDVAGQKWYNVCYDGNIGWVSGQYAVAK